LHLCSVVPTAAAVRPKQGRLICSIQCIAGLTATQSGISCNLTGLAAAAALLPTRTADHASACQLASSSGSRWQLRPACRARAAFGRAQEDAAVCGADTAGKRTGSGHAQVGRPSGPHEILRGYICSPLSPLPKHSILLWSFVCRSAGLPCSLLLSCQ
jgi:hypothetical protein